MSDWGSLIDSAGLGTGVAGISFDPAPSPVNALPLAIKNSASQLGIKPTDLATAIGYETAGTFDPWKKGPTTKWGTHRGLIQWGEPQAAAYGVSADTPPDEQMVAATQYLKDAGVKPGMGLLDVYSAINAGKVGRYNASDRPGMTVAKHVDLMKQQYGPTAQAMLGEQQKPMTLGSMDMSRDPTPSEAAANKDWGSAIDALAGTQSAQAQEGLPSGHPNAPLSGWTSAQIAELQSRKAPEAPSLTEKVGEAFSQANNDPVGAISGAVGKLYDRATGGAPPPGYGDMKASPAWSGRLSGDVETGINSLGPLGSEFSPGFGAGAEMNAVERGAAKSAPEAATGARPILPTGQQLVDSGIAKMEGAKEGSGAIPTPILEGMNKELDSAVPSFARRRSNDPTIDRDLYPTAATLQDRFKELATEPANLQDIHNLRQKLAEVLSSPKRNERKIGSAMRDHLDDFVYNELGPQFGQGIEEYARGARSLDFQNLVESASRKANGLFTGSGFENALTTKLRQIADNPKRLRVFTSEQQDAIKRFANGGSGARRVAKAVGRFAVRGSVSGLSDVVIGSLLHGIIPGGPAGVMVAGEAGRQIATHLAKNEIQHIDELIRAGSLAELQKFKQRITPKVYDEAVKSTRTRNIMKYWLRSGGGMNASRQLSIQIAKQVGVPNLAPHLFQELQGLAPSQAQPEQQQ